MIQILMLAMALLIPKPSHAMFHLYHSYNPSPSLPIAMNQGYGASFGVGHKDRPTPPSAPCLEVRSVARVVELRSIILTGLSKAEKDLEENFEKEMDRVTDLEKRFDQNKKESIPLFEFSLDMTPAVRSALEELTKKQLDLSQQKEEFMRKVGLFRQEQTKLLKTAETFYSIALEAQESDLEMAVTSYRMALGALDFIADLTPGVSAAKSLVEAATGQNYITGESLTDFERAQAILNVASLGGFGPMKKVFQVIGHIPGADGALKITREYVEKIGYDRLREGLTFLHKHFDSKTEMGWQKMRDILSSFTPDSKVMDILKGTPVYRYYDEVVSKKFGHWVTPERLDLKDTKRLADVLALPSHVDPSSLKEAMLSVSRDTQALSGMTYKKFGKDGGHPQIWLPDHSVLKELP